MSRFRRLSRSLIFRTAIIAVLIGSGLFFTLKASANERYGFLMSLAIFFDVAAEEVTDETDPAGSNSKYVPEGLSRSDWAGIRAAYEANRISGGGSISQEAYLKPGAVGTTQTFDNFGYSVAVSGDTVVVGAKEEDSSSTGVNSVPNELSDRSGAAYVFTRNAGVWTQQAYLKPAAVGTTQDLDFFGFSVAVSGDTVVVGAPNESSGTTGVNSIPDENSAGSGAAYVFTRSAGVWTQQAYLKPAAIGISQNNDQFGTSVAVAGETVIVGAKWEDSSTTGVNSAPNEGAAFAGAAYIFTRSFGVWTQQAYLKPAVVGTGQAGDEFGFSVAVSGDTVVVGANLEDSSTTGVNSTPEDTGGSNFNSGAAYVFRVAGGVWTQQAYLKPAAVGTTQGGDKFGTSVAVSNDTVVVGASLEDSSTTGVNSAPDELAADSGAAFVFSRSAGVWTQQAYLKPAAVGTTQTDDEFGFAVAVSGDTVVVGARFEDSSTLGVNSTPNEGSLNSGAAYTFTRSASVWTQQTYLKPAAVGTTQLGDDFGWSVAVAGDTVVAGAPGERSGTTGVNSTPNESAGSSGAAYVIAGFGPTPSLVINEIDYDQSGTDTAEFIELKNVSGGTINLDPVVVELINGVAAPTPYQLIDLPNVNLASGAYYVICGDGGTVLNCDLLVTPNTNLVQNGAPDAVGLRISGDLVDTVSYEGDTGAPYTEGSGSGLIDDGVTTFQGISRFPDGADTYVNNIDLSPRCITPGTANISATTGCTASSPTPTPTNTATNTATSTQTNTATNTPTPTPPINTFCSSGGSAAITDDGYNGSLGSMASKTISVPTAGPVVNIQVDNLAINHGWIGDLVIKLQSPSGTVITLMSRPGFTESADDGTGSSSEGSDLLATSPIQFIGSAANSAELMGSGIPNTRVACFDDGICSYLPNNGAAATGDLSTFIGQSASGNWRLYVGDAGSGDSGTLNSVCLTMQVAPPTATATATNTSTHTPTNTSTDTPTPSETNTFTPTNTATNTPTPCPIVWSEQAHPTASDGAVGDNYGVSVSISGDTAIVGANHDNTVGGTEAGSAYVLTRSGTVWTEQQKLTASDGLASDEFGTSVSISGDTAIVGAPHDDTAGGANAGSAYVFTRSAGVWTQQQKLTASDGAAFDSFGYSVSIDGDTAIVGAVVDDTAGGSEAGSAYIFVRNAGVWTEQQKLTASDGSTDDRFGISVSISGDTVIAGAHVHNLAAGAAYVFTRSAGVWTQQQKLTASDSTAGDTFGFSVSISGDTTIVGASDAGSAYVFTRSGTVWTEQQKLTASDGAANDHFGISVSISGDMAMVGAYLDDTVGGTDAGSGYFFSRSGTVWTQQQRLTASDGLASDQFGVSVSISGDTTIVGADMDDTAGGANAGSVYIFNSFCSLGTPTSTWTATATSTPTSTATETFTPTPTATGTPGCGANNTLSGSQEVPPNGTLATGNVTATLNASQTTLSVTFNWTGLAAPANAAHIHMAPPGAAGPVIFGFTGFPPATTGAHAQSFTISPAQVADFLNGLYYINIHNVPFPSGQIRAQLTPVCVSPTPTATNTPPDTPTATATNTATETPTPAGTPSIGGTVTYGNAAAPPKYISNVTITGTGSPNVFTTTEALGGTAGQYLLSGFGAGSYTVSLSKTTGQNSVTSNDAAQIAQHVAGTLLITANNKKIAADTSGNGSISSNDAALIARFVAGLGAPIGNTNQWRFFVPNPTFPIGVSPTTRSYTDPIGNPTGEDFIGILIGEVSGNWTPSAARPAGRVESGKWKVENEDGGPERSVSVELPTLTASSDKEIIVPVSVQGIANKGVISYEFDLRYDASVMQPLVVPVDVKDTASRGLSVVTNATEPGLLRVVVYGAFPIDENGVLLNLRFTAVGAPGSVSPLTFERIMFNEGEPRVTVANGKVELY